MASMAHHSVNFQNMKNPWYMFCR